MDLYEAMYIALVRRLEEIADAKDGGLSDDWTRVGCYDMVAHAHAMGLEKIRKEAEVGCD